MAEEILHGTVVRYCKPCTIGSKVPTYFCFKLREGETYLSVYLLDYFEKSSEQEKVMAVKQFMENKKFQCKPSGVFATLDVYESKQKILEFIEQAQAISYHAEGLPHCGISHEYYDDLVIAQFLSECVVQCYPVKEL